MLYISLRILSYSPLILEPLFSYEFYDLILLLFQDSFAFEIVTLCLFSYGKYFFHISYLDVEEIVDLAYSIFFCNDTCYAPHIFLYAEDLTVNKIDKNPFLLEPYILGMKCKQ